MRFKLRIVGSGAIAVYVSLGVSGAVVHAQGVGAPALPPSAIEAPVAKPFNDAVSDAARHLLRGIKARTAGAVMEIVVDPLVDGTTGLHTVAASQMGQRIAAIASAEFPHVRIVPFTPAALARKPVVMIGTITLAGNIGPGGSAQAPAARPFAIWFTAAEAATGEIVSKARATAMPDGVDPKPMPSQNDAAVWRKDAAQQAYIDSCRQTKIGDKLVPAYIQQLEVSALVASANDAYDRGQTAQALAQYRQALALPGGAQTRVYNGIYSSLARLGRQNDAESAFGDLVAHSLEAKTLATKFVFRPGTGRLQETAKTRSYPMWIRQIARKAAAQQACLEVVGHTSPTGPAAVNDTLSQLRAEHIRGRLVQVERGLEARLVARGVGSRETLIGTGKDDASDALDRRVEFKVLDCR